MGITQTRGLPAKAKRKLLRHIHPRILRADHSDTPLTLDEYCSRPHVLVSHTANVSGFADEWLAEIGRKRQVVLSVPQYSALPFFYRCRRFRAVPRWIFPASSAGRPARRR